MVPDILFRFIFNDFAYFQAALLVDKLFELHPKPQNP